MIVARFFFLHACHNHINVNCPHVHAIFSFSEKFEFSEIKSFNFEVNR